MNDEDLRQLITDMLAAEGLEAAMTADGGLHLSSLQLVRLLVSLEERLDVAFDDAAILNSRFTTVDDIIGLVTNSAATPS